MTSSAQLQREAERARVGLADTLSQLRDGVAPSALSGEALALVKESGLSILKALADQARANPVPALLIGAGLTMLLTRTTGSDVLGAATSTLKSAAATGAEAARGAASSVASAASGAAIAAKEAVADAAVRAAGSAVDAAAAAGDRVAGTMASASESMATGVRAGKETVGSAKDRLQTGVEHGKEALDVRRQQAGDLSGQARSMAEDARQSIARLIDEQPILMAALGAALGAAVGAALPLSQAEKDLLGETGAKAVGAGREALSGASNVVREEVSTADIGAKMADVADQVVQNLTKDIVPPR